MWEKGKRFPGHGETKIASRGGGKGKLTRYLGAPKARSGGGKHKRKTKGT